MKVFQIVTTNKLKDLKQHFYLGRMEKILDYSRNKFKLVCTPFDEISVANVIKDNFDYLKIASCSATD